MLSKIGRKEGRRKQKVSTLQLLLDLLWQLMSTTAAPGRSISLHHLRTTREWLRATPVACEIGEAQ